MAASELQSMRKEEGEPAASIETLLAGVSLAAGFQINDDITLARFNEYRKLLKAKTKKDNE